MGLGICFVGLAILLGLSLNSEKVYLLYVPPGFLFFIVGQWMTKKKS
jgi:hypothetical protein